MQATRRTLSEKARSARLELAEIHHATGDSTRAPEMANHAVRQDPLNNDANTMLIKRMLERGQMGQAIQAFQEFDCLMFRELGRHPPRELRSYAAKLLEKTPLKAINLLDVGLLELLSLARTRMAEASGNDKNGLLVAAIEDTLRLTQSTQNSSELGCSRRALADTLTRREKHEYAGAVLRAVGDKTDGPCHESWRILLTTDSHATISVSAIALAKEALP